MFSLAHISDLHIGPLPEISKRELMSKRITGYINWKRNRSDKTNQNTLSKLVEYHHSLEVDHTAITGDLINLGLPKEIDNAKQWLENFSSPVNATVVCGNHDAYVRGALKQALKSWQPFVAGDDAKPILGNENFPSLRRRKELSIISCNSAIATAPFLASGKFTKKQSERLAGILKQETGRYRVVLIHHPPFPNATHIHKRMQGVDNFTKAISQSGCELVLHGHTHLKTINHIKGAEKNVPVICVPAAYQWTGHHKPAATINLFKISGTAGDWSTKLERHSLQTTGAFKMSDTHTL